MKKDNIQLLPVKTFKIVIDNLSRKTFDADIPANKSVNDSIVESRRKNVISEVTFDNIANFDISLDEFDRAVYSALMAEQMAGNEVTTTERIFRRLGGKRHKTADIFNAINDSVERLASIRVTVIMDDACEQLNYKTKSGNTKFRGYLLPTESLTTTINGQEVTAIHFLKRGAIFGVADLKNQVITCDVSLIDVPVRTTPRTIAVKHYCLRRTLEIINSNEKHRTNKRVKPLRKTISFSDLLDKCNLTKINRSQKRTIKDFVTKIFDFFVEEGIIKNWHFELAEHQKLHTIVIDF